MNEDAAELDSELLLAADVDVVDAAAVSMNSSPESSKNVPFPKLCNAMLMLLLLL
jgi:hypothetical protein